MANQSRRTVIKAGLAGIVAAGASGVRVAEAQTPARAVAAPAVGARLNGPLFFDVETTSGLVRGMANTGIKVFRGIPYGAATGGKNRFMPPRKPAPWTGVRECIGLRPDLAADAVRLSIGLLAADRLGPPRRPRRHGRGLPVAERLDAGRRTTAASAPVLVSFHGGGWATGSGNGPMYDGDQLALLGDVVVVTVNHRLASFGYTHLAAVGRAGGIRERRRLRRDGHGRVARVGARQHRDVRRRSVARDDLRPVGRRLEDLDPAGDAGGQGPVPPRRGAVRLDAAACRTRPTRTSPRISS